MAGALEPDRLQLRPEAFYRDNDIAVVRGDPVVGIDREVGSVRLRSGARHDYDQLALATGSRPRRFDPALGGDLPGVETLRDIGDSDRIRAGLRSASRVLIVGGGYIGLEVAACARTMGREVMVAEAAPRLLARVAGEDIAARIAALHESRGVRFRLGASLRRIGHEADGSLRAEFAESAPVPADLVIVGIGAIPETEIAKATGLAIEGGIRVDQFCRTSDPRVFAAGDCTSFPLGGERVRLESVQNAVGQGEAAAKCMLGEDAPYQPVPWFWSDQYDAHLQIAGLSTGHDRAVTRSVPDTDSMSVWYYRDNRLLAVDAIDDARAYMVGKRLIERGLSPDPTTIANPDTNLKSLLRDAR